MTEGIGLNFGTGVDYDLEYNIGYFSFHENAVKAAGIRK